MKNAAALLCFLAICDLGLLAQAETATQNVHRSPAAAGYKYAALNFPGASSTLAYAINNSGEIVGYYTGAGCSQSECGFTDIKGKFATIECALENSTELFDISNNGEIAGAYSYYGGVHGFTFEGNSACFDIVDASGPAYTEAWGVNNSGEVVGFYIDAGNDYQGFSYRNGSYTTISCPGWTNTRAYGINDAGEIVGDVSNSTAGPFSAFSYKSGKCSIFNYPNASSTFARGVNKSGQISGFYENSSSVYNGFVKTGSSYQSLDYPDSTATLAYHLNDQGQVAGFYSDAAGTHGFDATPKK